ncbi:MAG: hypothetical protein IJZ94_04015 [Clostridia bacterium]|nr:hypothetical protein [Clostridia bacterium]
MDVFLEWLEKYDLLLELIITVLTISLSLIAVFQTRSIAKRQLQQEASIAKQQAELQERQIKISVYEQKNEINKTLNIVFDIAESIILFLEEIEIKDIEQKTLYNILKGLVGDINVQNISYTLEQSQSFLNTVLYIKIRLIKISFANMTTSIDCLNLMKDDVETKKQLIDTVRSSCDRIKLLKSLIEEAMDEELKLLW